MQWWIQLLVEGLSGSDGVQDAPALVLRWQVWQRAQPQPWLELRHDVPPARESVNAATPRTDAWVRQAVARSAQALSSELDRRLSCDPQPMPLRVEDTRWTLPAGELAGVRQACLAVLPELKTQLRALLHYHLGTSRLRTRQVMLDVQRLLA